MKIVQLSDCLLHCNLAIPPYDLHNNQPYLNEILAGGYLNKLWRESERRRHHRITQLTENEVKRQWYAEKQAVVAKNLTYNPLRVGWTFNGVIHRVESREQHGIPPPILQCNPVPSTRISPNLKALTWCVRFRPHRLKVFDNGLTLFSCGASTFDGTRRQS